MEELRVWVQPLSGDQMTHPPARGGAAILVVNPLVYLSVDPSKKSGGRIEVLLVPSLEEALDLLQGNVRPANTQELAGIAYRQPLPGILPGTRIFSPLEMGGLEGLVVRYPVLRLGRPSSLDLAGWGVAQETDGLLFAVVPVLAPAEV